MKTHRWQGVRVAAAGMSLLWVTAGHGDSPQLRSVDVLEAAPGVRVVLDVEAAVVHRTFRLPDPDRIVVDLVGTTNRVRAASRTLATGPVARLRVSQFKGAPEPVARVVADLRAAATYTVEAQDEDLVLVITPAAAPPVRPADVGQAPAAAGVVAAASAAEGAAAEPAAVPGRVVGAAAAPALGPVPPPAPAVAVATPPPATAETASAMRTPVPAVYVEDTTPEAPPGGVELKPANGRKVNLDVQGADIHTVLRTLADFSGKNIIASREVEGTVSARLYDTPWDDALNSILRAHGYGFVEENGIIRVGVVQKLRNEALEEAAAERKREDLLPIETRVVRMQFAAAGELKPALSDMLSSRGKIQVDGRTNALIISDIPDFVAKIAGMATDLDSRTPQVEIVSKLVDVSADESQNLGITWQALNVQPAGSPVLGAAGVAAPTTGAVGTLRLGTVQSWGALDAVLDALARSKRANIVSNPTITTVNNREAKILVGAKIPLIVADQAGNAITQLTTVGIQMRVTPHVNSDQTITMDLHPEVSELSSQATVQGGVIIQTSEADTRVLVDNGETAIIGGLVRNVDSEVRTGVPVLQDIPLLGMLFRNTNKVSDKRELIIFVTPRILEAGAGRG